MSGAHGHIDGDNKKIALLIAVLALFLAIAETMAKGAETNALGYNVEAWNLWAFFQAKTVRQTALNAALKTLTVEPPPAEPSLVDARAKLTEEWTATVARWESEPETGEGRKELRNQARVAEAKRDLMMAKYHHYEVSSAAFQIAIVLASAAVITGAMWLTWLSGALGVLGLTFGGIGVFAPHAVHLF